MYEPSTEPLVRVEDVSVYFPVRGGLPFGKKKQVKAVDHISLCIPKGETFGLVGESGCGKSTLANAILGMVRPTSGKIFFRGTELTALSSKELRQARREMQMIFQDPFSSLNPRFDVYQLISEPMLIRGGYSREEMEKRVIELLYLVGLTEDDLHRYPSDFSGGQRQRIGIARALIMGPEFIIADEPISALDVSIRAQVLNLLAKLQKERDLTYLFVAHDLSVMRFITDRIAVIHKGVIVELSETEKLFAHPLHPYTRALLSAIPLPDPIREREKVLEVYDPDCHDYSVDKPEWVEIEPEHFVLGNKAELEGYRRALEG